MLRIALSSVLVAAAPGCFDSAGNPPPSGVLNFPIASATLTVDPAEGPRYLFVANSNFDLRYNSATLQSYDLEVLNSALDTLCTPVLPPEGCVGPIPAACVTDPEGTACQTAEPAHATCALVPRGSAQVGLGSGVLRVCEVGPVDQGDPAPRLLVDEVRIGSFADGIEVSPDGTRIYLPVRSDADITRVDVNGEGQMDCGGGFGTTDACLDSFRVSDRSVAASRDLDLPPDPVALHVGPLSDFPGHDASEGNYLVMAHRAGEVSYFIDPRTGPEISLVDVQEGFPVGISTLAREPATGLLWGPVTASTLVARVGVTLDESYGPDEVLASEVFDGLSVTVPFLAPTNPPDLRDVAFDPRPGNDAVYLLSRFPSALIIADREVDEAELLVRSLVPREIVRIGTGPSRLAIAELETSAGPRMFAFVSCFDSRDLHVVDVDLGQLVAVVRELSGPFEIELDTVRKRLYVVDFRTSVVRVVDLEPMLDCLAGTPSSTSQECSPELIGLIGVPEAAEELE